MIPQQPPPVVISSEDHSAGDQPSATSTETLTEALRYRVRQMLRRQTLDGLRVWLDYLKPKVTPRSKLAEALAYLDN